MAGKFSNTFDFAAFTDFTVAPKRNLIGASPTLVGSRCINRSVACARSVNDKIRWTSHSSFVYVGVSRVRGL